MICGCDSSNTSDNAPCTDVEINSGKFTSGGASIEFIGEYPNGYFNVVLIMMAVVIPPERWEKIMQKRSKRP